MTNFGRAKRAREKFAIFAQKLAIFGKIFEKAPPVSKNGGGGRPKYGGKAKILKNGGPLHSPHLREPRQCILGSDQNFRFR